MTLWLRRTGTGNCSQSDMDISTNPAPCIMAGGIGGGNCSQYYLDNDGAQMTQTPDNKPPYSIPTMAEINALPWNGLKVASTFSGAGGSCLGYRMAGYRVVWANEFVPIAQDSYCANKTDDCYLDKRDIKLVQPEDILSQTGLAVGELDLFDGSPPCQAFSTAGKREKGWGKKKQYEHGAAQCNEQLFGEYIRLLDGLQPRVFVAENVSGLVKGTAKGYFLEILAGLKACGYRVKCKLLDAQWLGVPQSRQRTIFVGVRNDLNMEPVFPKPLPYRYSVRDALPWIMKAVHDTSGSFSCGEIQDEPAPCVMANRASTHFAITGRIGTGYKRRPVDQESPAPAIVASGAEQTRFEIGTERRKFTIAEVKRICAFPNDFVLCGSYAQQWERLGNSVPPLMMRAVAEVIRDEILLNV